jgi:hypothetical protein
LDLHLSHHSTKREACLSLLFLRIRINEWHEGKAIPKPWQNKMIRFFSCNSKVHNCTTRVIKKTVYSRRKAITVCKAFMCAMVLASLDPWAFCCIFFRCFHMEKTSRRKVVRNTVKGMK